MTIPPLSSQPSESSSSSSSDESLEQVSFRTRINSLSESIFSAGADVFSRSHALLRSSSSQALAWIGYKQLTAPVLNLEELMHACDDDVKNERYVQAKEKISDYVTRYLSPSSASVNYTGKSGHTFLCDKFNTILIDSEISIAAKHQILHTIQQDFNDLIHQVVTRVGKDLERGKLQAFNIRYPHQLVEIVCCGKETHGHGKIPLKLVFDDGTSVMYKPRSMQAEFLLCNPETSVFQQAGLGTYQVVCLSDDEGAYGYSEYLKNIQQDNVMHTVEEVQAYVDKCVMIDRLASELRISDLHCNNVITTNKMPYCIDLEVYLNPPETPSGIFGEYGAINTFDPYLGSGSSPTNKIWFDDKITEGKEVDFHYDMKEESLLRIGVKIQPSDLMSLSDEVLSRISSTKESLQEHPGRFVLIPTNELIAILPYLEPVDDQPVVLEIIQEHLKTEGFTYIKDSEQGIIAGIKEDALHNDVPIFYYNSKEGTVLYHGHAIGKYSRGAHV